ncbi:MAG: sigma-54-dependent Fis family transcriptional regulator [Polyangiaceae bacterium]|nr:sigma-54-dependent Fis family transcriptional regulator [Polyangiaceae bacterium]
MSPLAPLATMVAPVDGLLVLDPEMRRVYDVLGRLAATPLPVLVTGETGVGKEGAAAFVHASSPRAQAPFLRINCASLSETMLESELFGHERGSFTGAAGTHVGFFEAADGGTLFLDEIGELSRGAQAKLLRVLECGEIVRVGATHARRVDVRVVTATHRDLRQMVDQGEFREDLYFRLSGLTVEIPGLRARRSEILPLASLFLERAAQLTGRPLPRLTPDAMEALLTHGWPGNVRELKNAMIRAVALCAGDVVEREHLALSTGPSARPSPGATPPASKVEPETEPGRVMREDLRAYERARILEALQQTAGNQTQAAALLGISRRTLTNKLNAHAIARPRKRVSGAFPAVACGEAGTPLRVAVV